MALTLEQLQRAGSLAGGFKEAAFKTAIELSTLQKLSEDEQAAYEGAIVIDTCRWAATTQGIPIAKADKVYSCDGEQIGCYNKRQRIFFKLELVENKLATIGQYKLPEKRKEPKNMANGVLGAQDLSQLSAQLTQDAGKMGSFDNVSDDKPKSKAAEKREEKERELNEIRSKLSTETIVDRGDAQLNNQRHGRLLNFITKSDPSLRLSVVKEPILDEHGNYIPEEDTPADVLQAVKNGEKKLPSKYAKKEKQLRWKHVKPAGKPVGAVIATPMSSEVSFTKLVSDKPIVNDDKANQDLIVRFVDSGTLHAYVAANYGKFIQEDDRILGAKATKLRLKATYKKVKDEATGTEKSVVNAVLLPIKKEGRSALLVPGNFVPLKTFVTISGQDLSEANKATLNLLVEQAMKNKSYAELGAESQKMIKVGEDGSYQSGWFNDGVAVNVEKYDRSGTLTSINFPVVEKKRTKDGTSWNYRFQYNDLDSEESPLKQPQYAAIVKLSGKTPEEYAEAIKPFGARKSSGSKNDETAALSADDYLAAIRSKSVVVAGVTSFQDLQSKLEGLE